jgi:hypothetical protein
MSTATIAAPKTASEKTLLAMGHTGFFQRRTTGVVVSIYSEWSKTDPAVGMSKRFAIELHDYVTHKYVRGYVVELKTASKSTESEGAGTFIVGTQSSQGSMEYSTGVVMDNGRIGMVSDSDQMYADVLSRLGGQGSRAQLEQMSYSARFLASKLTRVENPLNKLQVEDHAQTVMLLTEIGKSAEFLAKNTFGPIPPR